MVRQLLLLREFNLLPILNKQDIGLYKLYLGKKMNLGISQINYESIKDLSFKLDELEIDFKDKILEHLLTQNIFSIETLKKATVEIFIDFNCSHSLDFSNKEIAARLIY